MVLAVEQAEGGDAPVGLVGPDGEDLGPGGALLHVGGVRAWDEPFELLPSGPREVRCSQGPLGHPFQ
eukprot:5914061-Pyramimonas_sp.AAC.1